MSTTTAKPTRRRAAAPAPVAAATDAARTPAARPRRSPTKTAAAPVPAKAPDITASEPKARRKTTDAAPARKKRDGVNGHDSAGKLVRDRFSMPAEDYDLIKLLKQRASGAGRPTKKSELLRAGLHALRESGTVELVKSLDRLAVVRGKGDKR